MKYIKHAIKLIILLIVIPIAAYTQVKSDTAQNKAQNEEYKLHNDWPNLHYYQNDNKKINARHNSGNRVVFMGNSITELWAEVHPEFFRKHNNFIDRGISGQTTPQMLLRFRQDVIDLKPKMVVILGGTNDIAGNTGPATLTQIFGNLVSMAQLAKASHIKVIISSVLPVYDYPWNKGKEPAPKIIRLNNLLKAYAKAHGLTYVDYHTAMKDERNGLKQELTADGVHPNKNGYLIMEKLLENKL